MDKINAIKFGELPRKLQKLVDEYIEANLDEGDAGGKWFDISEIVSFFNEDGEEDKADDLLAFCADDAVQVILLDD